MVLADGEAGSVISREGLAKRVVRAEAWAETGVRARFLRGREVRLSKEVGMDSGIGSDILVGQWSVRCRNRVCQLDDCVPGSVGSVGCRLRLFVDQWPGM